MSRVDLLNRPLRIAEQCRSLAAARSVQVAKPVFSLQSVRKGSDMAIPRKHGTIGTAVSSTRS